LAGWIKCDDKQRLLSTSEFVQDFLCEYSQDHFHVVRRSNEVVEG
jgi:hypothetical protein